jgi:diaminobutyrate-2-oxoglutarate transaminase
MLHTNIKLVPTRSFEINYRRPCADDGADIWRLIHACGRLDENSRYCNLLQCDHFAATCVAAERKDDGALIGWASAYLLPDEPGTLFVWQVAVDASVQGMGIGSKLLNTLLARDACADIRTLKATITPDNRASWALFNSLARARGGKLSHKPHFLKDRHFDGKHATEQLVTIQLGERVPTESRQRPQPVLLRQNDTRSPEGKPMTIAIDDKQIFIRRESAARSYCRHFPTVFARAEGAILTDTMGRHYIDFLAGCSTLNYGHNDPDMKAALIAHVERNGVAHGLDMHTDAKAGFLSAFERLILRPRNMEHRLMFTGPTGANAVEAALKLARKVTGRQNVVAFTNGFHGVTLGALAATGNGYHRGGAGVPLNNVTRMPYEGMMGGDIDTADLLDRMLTEPSSGIDKPAAVLLETVQGEGGLNAASPEWLRRVATIARKHGALLVIDDIQAGCGRTGHFFSFEKMGISPDLITMAKSLSGYGLPFAAVLVKPQYDVFGPAEHNGTFRGNNHAFVTARVALEKFWADDAFRAMIAERSGYLAQRLTDIAALLPGARVKGRGMMMGIDVGSGTIAGDICKRCFLAGLIIETSGAHDEVVKILCPLTIDQNTFARGLDILQAAVTAVAQPTNSQWSD